MTQALTVVVVAYDMARELPRTLLSLDRPYQRGLDVAEYEVIVVDNGTPNGLDPEFGRACSAPLRIERLDPAPASPACAANHGVNLANGELVGLIIDGARLASPGLLAMALKASALATRAVITSPAYHLGSVRHAEAGGVGYDQSAEDELLERIGWQADGYQLFTRSTLADSSSRGWFNPMGESSALFMPKQLWRELGGLDERFAMPGGGLVNHDVYRRACELPGAQLVELLGEGTFHQLHGGAATESRFGWGEMHAEYEAIRGESYRPPENEPLYLGRIPTTALPYVARSAELARERRARLAGTPVVD
jgi:hypothetical protein